MNEQQALTIIKTLIDVSIKRGVFENINAAIEVSNAFNFIADKLTVKEVNELLTILKEEHGIEPAAAAVVAAPAAGGESVAAEEKNSFDVILTAPGGAKLQIVKLVKELTGLGLKEAKAVVDAAPTPIKENIKPEEAEAIKEMLEEAGAAVSIKK